MNTNMLIVLSLVAAALCAPGVPQKFEEIEAPGDTSGSRRTHGDVRNVADMAERNNELFAEEDLSPKKMEISERRKRSLNTNALRSLSKLFEEDTILTSGPAEDFAREEDEERKQEPAEAEPYKGPVFLNHEE